MNRVFCNCLRHHPSRGLCIHDIRSFPISSWQGATDRLGILLEDNRILWQFLFFLNWRSFNSLFLYLVAVCLNSVLSVLQTPTMSYFPAHGGAGRRWHLQEPLGESCDTASTQERGPLSLLIPHFFFLAPGDELFNCLMCHHVLPHYRPQSNTAN